MQCPSCLRRLTRQRTAEGFVWTCSGCRGRSLTLPVLRNAGVRAEFINALWQRIRDHRLPGTRACPHCGRNMSQVSLQMLVDRLTLDACSTCRAIWFDAGEYEAVPHRPVLPVADPAERMDPKAREALAILEVQQQARRQDQDAAELGPEEHWQWLPALLGLPIEVDGPSVSCKPWVTWGLVVACVLAFTLILGTGLSDSRLFDGWGFVPSAWHRHGLLTLGTSFFLHVGFLHLLSNMWALWVFGDNVEDQLGPWAYGLMVAGGHLAGMVLHAGFGSRPDVPCVGASAGISSVIAYYAIAFPRVRLGMLIWFRWFRISAGWAIILYAVLQAIGVWQQVSGLSNVSYLGHVGGLAVGICTAVACRGRRQADTTDGPASGAPTIRWG